MSCCNNFTGDEDYYEAEISHHDNFVGDDDYYEAEISHHDNFSNFNNLDFDAEVESDDDMEEFFGKKHRARKEIRKQLRSEGVSRKEARQTAKAQIGKGGKPTGIGGLLDKVQTIKDKIETAVAPSTETGGASTDEVYGDSSDALADTSGGIAPKKAGMGMPLIIGGVAVAGILGFLAWRKWGQGS